MKVYKVEIMIIDFDRIGPDEIKEVIEEAKYPNRCIYPSVMRMVERDIGEWDDRNPLNLRTERQAEYDRLFNT